MSVSLAISITSPLDEKDHELLAGLAMMTLAIANHEGAIKNTEENEESEAEEKTFASPALCGFVTEDGAMICISKAGHRGRHKLRPVPTEEEVVAGLPN